jgi:stage V sporulation protein B
MNKTQKSFVKGAAILGMLGLVCKVIGAVYRIPMAALIGEEGMAYYQAAYPLYVLLLAVASAGLPVAISKMVSERVTLGDYAGAHGVFRTAFRSLIVIGLVTAAVMALLSGTMANLVGIPDAKYAFLSIAPALFFVSVISAYRGYFQGLQRMAPTAFSQLIEQVGKLGLGLFFAGLWKDYGLFYGAAGAMLGVTLSEAIALVFMLILYRRSKSKIKLHMQGAERMIAPQQGIGRQLFILALPIIIGACAMPLVQMADTAIVTNSLLDMGYSQKGAESLFGLLTGFVNPLINMPAVLSLALAMSLVPAISASRAQRDEAGAAAKSAMGFKLALLVGLPCAAGFYLLAQPIMHMLFANLQGESLATAGVLLQMMAIGVLFLTLVQTMTGILQGIGKTYLPVINLFIGVTVKIIVSLIFIRIPEINVRGAAIGTVACYAVAAVLDIACVLRHARFRFRFGDLIGKPLLSAGVMGVFVYFAFGALSHLMSERLAAAAVIALSAIIYFLLFFLFGALKKEDMAFIPGGARLTRLMIKFGVWKER